jgi:hypothetical protein
MNATTVENTITDQATATAALHKVRDDLAKATSNATNTMKTLRDTIVRVRPSGLLTVDQMAEAVGRDRNYVDSVWSSHGDTTKGKQTRVAAVAAEDENASSLPTYRELADAAGNQRGTASTVNVMRAERDRVVAMVYASKILGPSAIAAAVDIDRNHVLRIARKAKVAPAWRPAGTARNQHTAS